MCEKKSQFSVEICNYYRLEIPILIGIRIQSSSVDQKEEIKKERKEERKKERKKEKFWLADDDL